MFCQTCGSPNNQSANFCGKCGVSMSNGQSSASDSTNGKQPLSFREYMESRVKLQNEGVELTSIQKRKTNERISQNSNKKTKKDEIVKVLAKIFTKLTGVYRGLQAFNQNQVHWWCQFFKTE